MKKLLFLLAFTSFFSVKAQHEGHNMDDMKMSPKDSLKNSPKEKKVSHHTAKHKKQLDKSDSTMKSMDGMADMESMHMDSSMMMSHSFSRNLPMNRNGSGTSWLPDSTPMYAYMKHTGKWNFMFHGAVWLRYNYQDIGNKGTRGDSKFDAPNWFMAMGQRKIKKRGLFSFHAMFSLDALTVGGNGYPLLFQSGESWNGKPLIDRQHPHDLFAELAIGYTHMINKDIDIYGYFGMPGEPSIGPTTFMHRISSFNIPSAPIGHHWQDATHITFGVATAGIRYKILKVEGSSFTGREPNENRYNFDKPRFDSYSYRLSINPTVNYSFQISQASIKSPEELHKDEDVQRTTASIMEAHPLGNKRFITSALVWGMNNINSENEHSVLAESNLQLNKWAIFGRYEYIQKDGEELEIPFAEEHSVYNISAFTLGTSYILANHWNTNLSVGATGSIFMPDPALSNLYGRNPVSAEIYLRINPALMRMQGMGKMKM